MEIVWKFDAADLDMIRSFIAAQSNKKFVRKRMERNCSANRPIPSKSRFVRRMIGALVTTQQKSGPGSRASRFIKAEARGLAAESIASPKRAKKLVAQRLAYYGLRFGPTIGEHVSANVQALADGEWKHIRELLSTLAQNVDRTFERKTAVYLQKLNGFGPKQARNLLQTLGLIRYEMPLDSRVMKWLRQRDFPAPVSSRILIDEEYYCFVLDGLQLLCDQAGVLPCILDASIFAEEDDE